ncbi:hypothetical protein ACGK9U_16070 [Mariniflexile sp. HNIBRBA6329]|uniref:hypothetical protein n=1 Tax=Mariniflexile sp. HNIBRBA6329 TaxID=3373088 RepID=UPI003746A8BB
MTQKFIILITILTSATLAFACKNKEIKSPNSEILHKGELLYNCELSGIPLEFDFKFDEENVRINQKFISNTSSTILVKKNNKEVLHLNQRFETDKKFFYSSIDKMIALQKGSTYGDTITTKTKETKIILGYDCIKTIINLGKQVEITLWTTEKIKTGITFPNTPLTLNETALEYEMKINGKRKRYYKIESIKDIPENDKDFHHIIPDEYKLIVPVPIYSLNPIWSKNASSENLKSFEYPKMNGAKEEVKEYFSGVFAKVGMDEKSSCYLNFTINKSGEMEDLKVTGCDEKFKTILAKELKNMPEWIPGKVYGEEVSSELTISK